MNLDEELKLIESKLYTMFEKTIVATEKSFNYYLSNDGYDTSVYIDDDEINGYEREIESLCMKILLREKVYSSDLRMICGAMKLVADIERIGDQAFDKKRITDEIKRGKSQLKIDGMENLTSIVLSMVKSSLTLWSNRTNLSLWVSFQKTILSTNSSGKNSSASSSSTIRIRSMPQQPSITRWSSNTLKESPITRQISRSGPFT